MTSRASLARFAGSPLIIGAPATRCGTTLLQRLFSTGTDGIVFGEHVAAALQGLLRDLREQEQKHTDKLFHHTLAEKVIAALSLLVSPSM